MASVIRYFGGYKFRDLKNPTYTGEGSDVSSHQLLVEGIARVCNDPNTIVERYLVDTSVSRDRNNDIMPTIKLHSVYFDGVRMEDEKLEEYEKVYGYYGKKHLNSEDNYVFVVDFFMIPALGTWGCDSLQDGKKSVLQKYGEAYFYDKSIKTPMVLYETDFYDSLCEGNNIKNIFDILVPEKGINQSSIVGTGGVQYRPNSYLPKYSRGGNQDATAKYVKFLLNFLKEHADHPYNETINCPPWWRKEEDIQTYSY